MDVIDRITSRWIGGPEHLVLSRPVAKPGGPVDLQSFFETKGCCPDCGEKNWTDFQDGGHDVCFTCDSCGASFGIQLPPFNIIERLSP